jgi:PhnB protein
MSLRLGNHRNESGGRAGSRISARGGSPRTRPTQAYRPYRPTAHATAVRSPHIHGARRTRWVRPSTAAVSNPFRCTAFRGTHTTVVDDTTVKPIPDNYPQIVPYLCVDGASAAIEFYRHVFGATERMRMPEPDGRLGHAELEIGTGMIMLSDEFPDLDVLAPTAIGGTPVTMSLYVADVDDVFTRAIGAGATALSPVKDQF